MHDDDEDCLSSAPGEAPPGKPIQPRDLPADDEPTRQRRAPAPGTPLPPDEFQRLKEKAKRDRPAQEAPAQED